MNSKGKKIVISLAVIAAIVLIGIKVSGFQFAGPTEFAIFSIK